MQKISTILHTFQYTLHHIIYFTLHYIKISIFILFNYFSFFTHNNYHLFSSFILGIYKERIKKIIRKVNSVSVNLHNYYSNFVNLHIFYFDLEQLYQQIQNRKSGKFYTILLKNYPHQSLYITVHIHFCYNDHVYLQGYCGFVFHVFNIYLSSPLSSDSLSSSLQNNSLSSLTLFLCQTHLKSKTETHQIIHIQIHKESSKLILQKEEEKKKKKRSSKPPNHHHPKTKPNEKSKETHSETMKN